MLQYNQINLSVNGQYILADNVSLNQSSPIRPIYNLNNNIPFNVVPTTISNDISISYYMEPGNEPIYNILTGILFDSTIIPFTQINIGGIAVTGYLNSYSFSLSPNALIKVSSKFNVYHPLSSNLTGQLANDQNNYDLTNASGLAHYWTTKFYSGITPITNSLLECNYGADIGLTPIFSIGNYQPAQIIINKITESLGVLTEQQQNILYSGQTIENTFNNIQSLKISNISTIYDNVINNSITFPMTGFLLNNMKNDVSIDNIVLFNLTFNRYS